MKSDYEVIKCKLSREHKKINIYGIADWHVGSAQCDVPLIEKTIKTILKDKDGYCVICGDLMNNGLKQSKTNTYEETMMPYEQKEKVYELLKPLAEAGKILAITDGNHEYRSVREGGGVSPLYDIACRLRIEDVFRPYQCLMMVQFGRCGFGREGSYNTFFGLAIHGASRNKHRRYEMTIEPLDFCISGHTHQPEMASRGKIRIDSRGVAKQVNFKSLVVCPALTHGGYGIQKEYEPTGTGEVQYLTLKTIERDRVKRMEYHTSQL